MQHHVYSSFGKLLAIQDALGNDIAAAPILAVFFSYTGREFDQESGFYNYRARYYEPEIGRFVEMDPEDGNIFDPSSFTNKFIYASNNPVLLLDPMGLFSLFGGDSIFAKTIDVVAQFAAARTKRVFGKYSREVDLVIVVVVGGALIATGNPAAVGAGIGMIKGGIDGYRSGGNVYKPAIQYAAVGALAGFTGGAVGGAVAGTSTVSAIAGVSAGAAAGGIVGEITGQAVGLERGKGFRFGLGAGAIGAGLTIAPTLGGGGGASSSSSEGGGSGGRSPASSNGFCWCGGRLLPK